MRNKLTQDKPTMFIDQFGNNVWATSVKELYAKSGGGRVFKIYRDQKVGRTVHVGYGIGRQWFIAYKPVEVEQ